MKIEKAPTGLAAATSVARAASPVRTAAASQALRVEPGVIRLFGKGDIANRGLVGGWAAPEEGHTWNEGLTAVMEIEAVLPSGAMTISAEGVPYIFGDAKQQEITLYANGFWLGYWRLTERKLATLVAKIEPEQWFSRRGTGHVTLTWHIPGSARPSDLGDGADGRILGFAFRNFCLSEIKED